MKMTNKKAIEKLKSNKSDGYWEFMCGECPCECDESCELNQALDLAIKALEQLRWISFNYEAIEKGLLEDHCFYLVIHQEFETPMKAKFHAESYPYFEIYSHRGTFYSYIDDGTVSQFMKLPNKPKKEEQS